MIEPLSADATRQVVRDVLSRGSRRRPVVTDRGSEGRLEPFALSSAEPAGVQMERLPRTSE